MNKKKNWFLFFCFILMLFLLGQHWKIKELYYPFYFDFIHDNKKIETKAAITQRLASFEKVAYKDLEESYKDYTKSSTPKYQKLLEQKQYYKIKRADFYKFIVGEIRINALIAKDKYYQACLSDKDQSYYWLISEELLFKLLDLQQRLQKAAYNPKGFKITNGHRHPKYNERVGGASLSRHIKGEAIDLEIGDINHSGQYEQEDKDIVLDLLENQIIKSSGGIGRYPGTRALHFDVRGYKARWDQQ